MSSFLSDCYCRNPRLVALTIALILVGGAAALTILPQLEDPRTQTRAAFITVLYPGADAEQVESQVTQRIEEKIREVEGVRSFDAWSRAGAAVVLVRLTDQVERVDEAWSRLRDKLGELSAALPPSATAPEFDNTQWGANALVVALAWNAPTPADGAVLARLGQELDRELRYAPGVRLTQLLGATQEEVRVEVDPRQIAALGLTTTEIAERIQSSAAQLPGAPLRTPQSHLLMDIGGPLRTLEHVGKVPIRHGARGEVVRLADVASLSLALRDPPESLALVDGREAVAVAVRINEDIRIDSWRQDIQERLASFQARLPDSVALRVLFDQSRYTSERARRLLGNLALGVALVALVVFVMMGGSAMPAVGAALPLAILATLAGMACLGISIDQMSISGLILALGLLIDNPIIVVDDVLTRLRQGAAPRQAVSDSARRLFVPLLGSTVTTMLAFAPLLLMPGGVGEFMGSLAKTVTLAMAASLFLAFAVAPPLALAMHRWRLRAAQNGEAPRRWWSEGISSARMLPAYRSALRKTLASPLKGIAVAAALASIGFFAGARLPEQFFPPAERDQFQVQLRLPIHASLEETRRTALAAQERMLRHAEVESVAWLVGANAPMVHYSMIGGEDAAPYYAQALVKLASRDDVGNVVRRVQQDLDAAFPRAQSLALQFEQGPPPLAPIELRIYGPDLARLEQLGEQAQSLLANSAGVTHARATLAAGRPQARLALREEEARLVGLSNASIVGQLAASLRGVEGGAMRQAEQELPVRVRLAGADRHGVEDVASLSLAPAAASRESTAGAWIPYAALGQTHLTSTPAAITRRNGSRVNTIQAHVTAGASPAQIEAEFRRALNSVDFHVPPGYRLEFGGVSEERNGAVRHLGAYFSVLAACMAAALVLSLRSFRLAGIVAAVAVMSVGFGLAALWLAGHPLGMTAIVGIMGMIGVAINDSIVVLAALRDDPLARRGDVAAACEVVVRSTRHVLATTTTTIAGFAPLMLSGGGMWPPLATVMIGGVAGATLLALGFSPAAFLLTRPRPRWEDATGADACLRAVDCEPRRTIPLSERDRSRSLRGERPLPSEPTEAALPR